MKPDPQPMTARLHSGRISHSATALFHAQAFVLGRHVFLSADAEREVRAETAAGLRLLAHELAHVDQYRRRGVARFLVRYVSDYFAGRARGQSHREAYEAIGFEREARESARLFAASRRSSEPPSA